MSAGPGAPVPGNLSLTLTKGSDVRPVAAFSEGNIAAASATGDAILNAIAQLGAAVTLGGQPSSQIPGFGTPGVSLSQGRVITPGTPVPPSKGFWVSGDGGFVLLKLANGAVLKYPITETNFGNGVDEISIIDADVSNATNAVVTALYGV